MKLPQIELNVNTDKVLHHVVVVMLAVASGLFHGQVVAQDAAKPIQGTYAIQNVQAGKNLRPYGGNSTDNNTIVLYDHWRWRCMTWQMVHVSGESYHLVNRYTRKTFEPSSAPVAGVGLWQKAPDRTRRQEWDFIRQPDGTYLIRMSGTDLYVTISSEHTNSAIVLLRLQETNAQRWRLLAQDPWL